MIVYENVHIVLFPEDLLDANPYNQYIRISTSTQYNTK